MRTVVIQARIVRWIDDEPQPGIVECRFRDCDGREWAMIDKAPIFSAEILTPASVFPVAGVVAGEVIEEGPDGILLIDTTRPWDVETLEGVCRFRVASHQVEDWP